MPFIAFMASQAGRVLRIVVGLVLIAVGIALGGGWYALAAVGLLPLAAGAFDFCLLSPLFRLPLSGQGSRRACASR
ncbi:MAG: hypothetical protein NVS3B26_21150 [Mycobacteriales bacterium]